jgi:hypothetical protein
MYTQMGTLYPNGFYTQMGTPIPKWVHLYPNGYTPIQMGTPNYQP